MPFRARRLSLPLACGDGHFNLDAAPLPVHGGGDDGAPPTFHHAYEAGDIAAVQQQSAGVHGAWPNVGGYRRQRRDQSAVKDGLVVVVLYVTVAKLNSSGTQGLDFPAFERDAGFQPLLEMVFEARAPVELNG